MTTLQDVKDAFAAEKAARDIYFEANKTRSATKAQWEAMVAATKARQDAMTAYSATQVEQQK